MPHPEAGGAPEGEEAFAAARVLPPHALGVGARLLQRCDARLLGEVGRRDEEVLLQPLHGRHEARPEGHDPARAPPGHPVALGEAVQDERVVCEAAKTVGSAVLHG